MTQSFSNIWMVKLHPLCGRKLLNVLLLCNCVTITAQNLLPVSFEISPEIGSYRLPTHRCVAEEFFP